MNYEKIFKLFTNLIEDINAMLENDFYKEKQSFEKVITKVKKY